jgi:hypothetical protein
MTTIVEFRHGAWQQLRWAAITKIGHRRREFNRHTMEFAHTATMACFFELQARLFADATPGLEKHKDAQLEALVKVIVRHVGSRLQLEEVVLLKKCARMRNKLLHADFSKAAGTLMSLGVQIDQGRVHIVDLVTGDANKVSDTNSAKGRVFAWVLEGSRSCTFLLSRRQFARGIALFEWLLVKMNEETSNAP